MAAAHESGIDIQLAYKGKYINLYEYKLTCDIYDMQQAIAYKKTHGSTRGISGHRLEILLLMLVFLRCKRTKDLFFLGTSSSEGGKFDDIVLVWKEQGEYYAALVQAKHRKYGKGKPELPLRHLLATQKRNPMQGSYKDFYLGDYQKSYENVKERWKTFQGNRLSSVGFILLTNGALRKGDFSENVNKSESDWDKKITGIFGGTLIKLSSEQTQGMVHKEFIDSFRLLSLELNLEGLLHIVKMEIRESIAVDSIDCQAIYTALRKEIKYWREGSNPTYLDNSSDMWLRVIRGRLQVYSEETPEMESGITALDEVLKRDSPRIALISMDPLLSAGKVVRSLRDSGLWYVVLKCEEVAARPAEIARMWAASKSVLVVLKGDQLPAAVLGTEGKIVHVTTQTPGPHWFVLEDVDQMIFQGRPTLLRTVAPVQEIQLNSCIVREIGAPLSNRYCPSYTHRFLTRRQNLPSSFLRSVGDNEICAIIGVTYTKFKPLFPDLQPIYQYRNVDEIPAVGRVFCIMSSSNYFIPLCQKYEDRNIHLVKLLKTGRWKWERSSGDVTTVRQLLEGQREHYSEEKLFNSSDRALVVEGIPGMGISTLLRRMAFLWWENNENDWVMVVDLARCVTALSSLEIRNVDNVVTILETAEGAGNLAVGSLGRQVLKNRLESSGGVALFFDGVADMGSKNYSKLIDLLKFIVDVTSVSKLVVGVRLDSAECIEDSICSLAYRLEPLGTKQYNRHIQSLLQLDRAEDLYDFLRQRRMETPLLMVAGVKAAVVCRRHTRRWYEELVYQIVKTYVMRRLDMELEHPFFEEVVSAWTRLTRAELLGVAYPKRNLFTDCKYSANVGLVYSDRKQEKILFTHKGLMEYFNEIHVTRRKVALE